jgi:hypothetical protein
MVKPYFEDNNKIELRKISNMNREFIRNPLTDTFASDETDRTPRASDYLTSTVAHTTASGTNVPFTTS